MKLVFLGTASCYPTSHRAVSCIGLRQKDGRIWLFDCGEGSQVQLQKSFLKPGKITKIFITHLHGDHLFGLPGLICTLSSQCAFKEDFVLEIYGPNGLRQYVRQNLNLSRSPLPFKYVVHELVPESYQYPDDWSDWPVDHADQGARHPQEIAGKQIKAEGDVWTVIPDDQNQTSVLAGAVDHRIPSFGFVVKEAGQVGKLDVKKFLALGGTLGPSCSQLKMGESVTYPSGVTGSFSFCCANYFHAIHPKDVIGPNHHGKKVVILGDTCNSDKMKNISRNCDALVHEATLQNSMLENALEKGHSTPDMAAAFAQLIEAKMLVLTHFSQRYPHESNSESDPTTELLADEARAKLGPSSSCKVVVANDLLEVDI